MLKSKLEECNQEINGQNHIAIQSSMQVQRNLIIESISNLKMTASDHSIQEISGLPERYQNIIKLSASIQFNISTAIAFGQQIEKKLDMISKSLIENLKKKYEDKGKLIIKCDELSSKITVLIKDKSTLVETHRNLLLALIQQVEEACHMNTNTSTTTVSLPRLQAHLQEGISLRAKIEGSPMDFNAKSVALSVIVTPLSELASRVVTTI